MSKPTPTPWTIAPGVYDTSPETASEFPHGPEIIGVGGNSVASCNMFGEADAAFIVKAVNSHDALVNALQNARNYIDAVIINSPDKKKRRNFGDCLRIIDDALASIKDRV